MQQQKLPLGDSNALRISWTRLTDHQRRQVIAMFAELMTRAARHAHKKERHHDAGGK